MADIIQASWFYSYEFEKTKFNWFCFEYALKLYDYIKGSKKLKKWASGVTDMQIAQFCAYYSKRMKKSVEDKLAGITDATEHDEDYVSDYCHTNTGRQNVDIINVALAAWDSLLSVCETCPTRCISERTEECGFLNRMERGGYFS